MARRRRFSVLRGRATPSASQVAFGPLAEALLSQFRYAGLPDGPELEPFRRPILARLVPEWRAGRRAGGRMAGERGGRVLELPPDGPRGQPPRPLYHRRRRAVRVRDHRAPVLRDPRRRRHRPAPGGPGAAPHPARPHPLSHPPAGRSRPRSTSGAIPSSTPTWSERSRTPSSSISCATARPRRAAPTTSSSPPAKAPESQ